MPRAMIATVVLAAGLTAGTAWAAQSKPATTGIDQAAQKGAELFAHGTFDGRQTWVPPNSFSSKPMTCSACHTDGGRSEGLTPAGQHIPSLIGAAAKYPKYKAKKHAVYTLERQIVHCVRAGIMGQPPAYSSADMADLVAYLTKLSKGAPMGQQFK